MIGLARRMVGDSAIRSLKRLLGIDRLRAWRAAQAERIYERAHNERRADFLTQWLPKNGVGAELGVFRGEFSPILLRISEAQELHLIDPWYLLAPTWSWAAGNPCTIDALVTILQAFKPQIKRRQVIVHVGDDRSVLATFPDEYFDWVYIDSSHEYDHTCAELSLLQAKMKATGVIAGDDWRPIPTHRHHGVYRAVTELLGGGDYELIAVDEESAQWAIRQRRRAADNS